MSGFFSRDLLESTRLIVLVGNEDGESALLSWQKAQGFASEERAVIALVAA